MTALLLFLILLFIIIFGVLLMAQLSDILGKIAETNTHLDALIAQGANSIPPAGSDQIMAGVTALDEKIVGAIVPAP